MLQNPPNLDKFYQNNDILPCFSLHNAQIITFKGRQAVLIFVALIVDNSVDCGILPILISLDLLLYVVKNMLIYLYRVLILYFHKQIHLIGLNNVNKTHANI